jgi:hypothetical protein
VPVAAVFSLWSIDCDSAIDDANRRLEIRGQCRNRPTGSETIFANLLIRR